MKHRRSEAYLSSSIESWRLRLILFSFEKCVTCPGVNTMIIHISSAGNRLSHDPPVIVCCTRLILAIGASYFSWLVAAMVVSATRNEQLERSTAVRREVNILVIAEENVKFVVWHKRLTAYFQPIVDFRYTFHQILRRRGRHLRVFHHRNELIFHCAE